MSPSLAQALFYGNEEDGFSQARCDGCGTHLGGDRFGAGAMREVVR